MSSQPLAFFKSSCNSTKIANASRQGAKNFNCVKNPYGRCECQISTIKCLGNNCYPVTVQGCADCTSKCTSCETPNTLFTDIGKRPLRNILTSSEYWAWWKIMIVVVVLLAIVLAIYKANTRKSKF